MKCWFAVCCKPRQELVAQENLARQGFRVYLPRIRIKRRRRGQWLDVVEVLFPRYVFIHADPDRQSLAAVRSTRGAVGLVRFGGQPAVVEDEVMNALLLRENAASGLHEYDSSLFNSGEAVKLMDGPLAGMEGIFVQEDGERRAVILLELLGKANKVRVDRDLLVKAA
jgi:transcriptional antiterminator RfaH